jgi:hypothetical protein
MINPLSFIPVIASENPLLRKSFSRGHPHLNPLPEGEEVEFWIYEGVLLDRKDKILHASPSGRGSR